MNLEKVLLKQNKKLITPSDLLIVKEYDKFAPLTDNDALERVGMNRVLKDGRKIQRKIDLRKKETERFNQERVFHISQIKGICMKYRLRFLPASMYAGTIDDELPDKISTFEVAYDVRCKQDNTYIVAPAESFKLQEESNDPLMFYQINDEYYYLIHKWGNDLSFTREWLLLLENGAVCFLIFMAIALLPIMIAMNGLTVGISVILSAVIILLELGHISSLERPIRILEPNSEWNSKFK